MRVSGTAHIYCTSLRSSAPDYVLQRALTVADADQKDVLISRIKPQLASMRRYSSNYTKHLTSSMFSFLNLRSTSNACDHPVERVIEKYPSQQSDPSLPQLAIIPP
jgi:pumilio RNA-binding family